MLHQDLYSYFPHKTSNFTFNGELLNCTYSHDHNKTEWTSKSLTLIPWNGWKKANQLLEWIDFPFKVVDNFQRKQTQTISVVGRLTKDYPWDQLL